MKKNKNILLILMLLIFSATGYSQQSFTVASNSATINNMKFDYSIGEMTLVSTERNASIIVTQGQLQPIHSNTSASPQNENASALLANRIKVFPNPTENILNIESFEDQEATINYQLFDGSGKLIINKSLLWEKGPNKVIIELKSYAAGAYYLLISKPGTTGTLENFSYKIQKTN